MLKALPVCSFPSTIIFVDDQSIFLKTLGINLNLDTALYKFYTSPEEALNFLGKEYKPHPFTERYIFRTEEKEFDYRNIEIRLPLIYQEVYNPQRFQQISTVVVDYDMPSMKGLELCKRINIPHVQKILLTGAASEKVAVQAFNEGTIQGYIKKQDFDVYQQLNQAIEKAQQRYFLELSQPVLNSILMTTNKLHALKDPAFIQYFQQFCQAHQIIEYYLLDDQGSFMGIDVLGKRHGLYVYDERKMEGLQQLSLESENIAPAVTKALQEKEKILCYHTKNGNDFPCEPRWQDALYPVQTIQGEQIYYCAVTPDIFDVEEGKVSTFANIL